MRRGAVINDNYSCRSPRRRSAGGGSAREACDTARFPRGGRVGHGCQRSSKTDVYDQLDIMITSWGSPTPAGYAAGRPAGGHGPQVPGTGGADRDLLDGHLDRRRSAAGNGVPLQSAPPQRRHLARPLRGGDRRQSGSPSRRIAEPRSRCAWPIPSAAFWSWPRHLHDTRAEVDGSPVIGPCGPLTAAAASTRRRRGRAAPGPRRCASCKSRVRRAPTTSSSPPRTRSPGGRRTVRPPTGQQPSAAAPEGELVSDSTPPPLPIATTAARSAGRERPGTCGPAGGAGPRRRRRDAKRAERIAKRGRETPERRPAAPRMAERQRDRAPPARQRCRRSTDIRRPAPNGARRVAKTHARAEDRQPEAPQRGPEAVRVEHHCRHHPPQSQEV